MLRSVRFLLALAACLLPSAVMAAVPFVDLDSETAATYDAVQTLYDRYVIFDNGSHLFNPRGLINRDDFTSIVMEVGCERCLQPTPDLIFSYTSRVFPDVGFDNENFYCIARAESLGVVRGYVLDASGQVSCQDKTVHSSVPFCPVNSITRIEAAAVLLRHAGFWDETRNANAYDRRYQISDISEYWYGYAMRALDFELFPIDASGRVTPNEYINRAEFARMAAKILRSRICEASGSDIDEKFRASRADVQRYPNNSSNNGGNTGNNANWSNSGNGGGNNGGNGNNGNNAGNGNNGGNGNNDNGSGNNGNNASGNGNNANGNWDNGSGNGNNGNNSGNGNAGNGNNGNWSGTSSIDRTVSLSATVSYNPGTASAGGTTNASATNPTSSVGTANLSAISSAPENTYQWTLRSLGGETRSYSGSTLSGLDLCRSVWLGRVESVSPAGIVDATADVQVACPTILPPSVAVASGTTTSSTSTSSWACTSGTCACPAGFVCSTADARVCSTTGRCNPVNAISVEVSANPLVPMVRERADFVGVVSGGVGPYSYSWNFADGTTLSMTGTATSVVGGALQASSNPSHAYDTPGARLVELSVRDSAGNVWYASVSVLVQENDDYDGDGVRNNGDGTPDSSDLCPYVYGPPSQRGCPVVPRIDTSGSDVTTSSLYPGDPCQWNRLSGRAYMLGTIASCASCPCRYRADFAAGLAICDTVVPAILSPDKQTIYSRGNPYEIAPGR